MPVRLGLLFTKSTVKSPLPLSLSSWIVPDLKAIRFGVPETCPEKFIFSKICPRSVFGGNSTSCEAAIARKDVAVIAKLPLKSGALPMASRPSKLPFKFPPSSLAARLVSWYVSETVVISEESVMRFATSE